MSTDFIRTSTERVRGAATGEQNVPVKPEQWDDWIAQHDAEVAANTVLGIAHRLDTDDPHVGEQLVQFEDEWRKEAHAARPAAPSAPATPRMGAGTSEGAAGPQIGAGEVGLGDALRLQATTAPTRLRADEMRALADRADALEHDRKGLRIRAELAEETVRLQKERIERVRALADEWAALAPEDDWAEGGIGETALSDAGRKVLATLGGTQ